MSFGIVASSYKTGVGGGGDDAYSNQVLADSPLLYWRMDDASGPTVSDASGNGHTGTYFGTPTFNRLSLVSGSNDASTYFTADTNDYAQAADASWMDVGALTLTCVVTVVTTNIKMLISRYHDPDNDRSWFLYTDSGVFKFYVRGSDGVEVIISSGVTAVQGISYFLAAYCDASGSGIRVYGASGLLGSGTGTGHTVNPSTRSFMVARSEDGATYQSEAYIDEVAFYGSVLTTSRLDTLASMAMTLHPKWINRTVGVAARNGTASQTITFPATSANSLVVAIVGTPTTCAATTIGWTKRISEVNNTELAVFTRSVNAGETSLQIAQGAANYPLNYAVYEFPAGTAYTAGTSTTSTGFPTLSGLPGTPVTVFAVWNEYKISTSDPTESATWFVPFYEDVDMMTPDDGSSYGDYMTIAYRDVYTYTSATPVITVTNNIVSGQLAVFAITVP